MFIAFDSNHKELEEHKLDREPRELSWRAKMTSAESSHRKEDRIEGSTKPEGFRNAEVNLAHRLND
jgi:hypothetical protein